MNFQSIILALQNYWSERGCIIEQPYDVEIGAGTMNVATALRVLGPEPWNIAYVAPCRRPPDGRYGENPNRLGQYYQFQVILKPTPDDVLDVYFDSLATIGIDPLKHDLRLVEDNWEQPTMGAWGLGWEVWADGLEITQFTYFQQVGGMDLDPIAAEITYGLERIAMYVQGVDNVYDMEWAPGISYGEIRHQLEVEFSKYYFDYADSELHFGLFNDYEKEATRLLEDGLILPAYDYVLKCSHVFNVLGARGVIGVTERTAYLGRVRNLARRCAELYVERREELGYPLLKEVNNIESKSPLEVGAAR